MGTYDNQSSLSPLTQIAVILHIALQYLFAIERLVGSNSTICVVNW